MGPFGTDLVAPRGDVPAEAATLERVAQALGCRLEYVLVPERPLQEMVRTQAQRKAAEMLADVDHTMSLEQQRTDDDARRRTLDNLTDDFIGRRGLWSDT